MVKSVSSVSQLVEILGGLTATGTFFNVTRQEVLQWRHRNRLPPEYVLARSRLERKGIRVPIRLFGAHKNGRRAAAV